MTGSRDPVTSYLHVHVVWVCILCRKKQELLSKTGQWMTGAINLGEGDIMPPTQQAPSDKRPKLERAHSAAEKENQPLQRSGSVLRRQHSEQESPNPALDRYAKTYNEDDPRYYQGELEGLMRTHPHLVPRRYPEPEPEPSPMDISQRMCSAISANKKHKRSGSTKKHQHPPQPQLQRSFSSSEEDLKSTPEYGSDERDSEKGEFFIL
ncbi:regulating synaptic membrane exocytosis protein [Holotrichia oblita]|uniref:Regulating synaptic membrane exocytosis protein n=1 Tax=Holotrichia oblita TaxID=644536 RepID=A0ACB9TBH0_HOLOL|nr:regulating synaptic membrane exocytosis protein [Holotrichia oblita]